MDKITGIGGKLKTLLNIFRATSNIELKIKGIGKKKLKTEEKKKLTKGNSAKFIH